MTQAGKSANVVPMTMTDEQRRERARTANAALTTEQRRTAGKAGAAKLHSPETLADRLARAWEATELTDERKRGIRKRLRAAGIIS